MNGVGDGAIAMGVGTARAAVASPFVYFDAEKWPIEVCVWAGAFLALAGAGYLAVWWRSYGGRPLLLSFPTQQWPDFRKWDERTEFELYEAAALWFDAEPRLPLWWRARRKFQRWKPEIAGNAIPTKPGSLCGASEIDARRISSVTLHTRLHRATLKAMAEKEGSRPLFLFPERRVRSCLREDRAR
jgi:hypothetical protein